MHKENAFGRPGVMNCMGLRKFQILFVSFLALAVATEKSDSGEYRRIFHDGKR